MSLSREKRNVAVLSICQALFMTGQIMLFILNGLVGYALLGADKALATLPVSTAIIGVALITIPASMLMKKIGRRAGFMVGTGIGILGCILSTMAIYGHSFALFSVGTLVIGCSGGFAQYYRFAAADVASPTFKSKAISLVLVGGVFAAFVGPELAKSTNALIEGVPFVGTYLTAIALSVLTTGVLIFLDIPLPNGDDVVAPGRPMAEIARQPAFFVAVLGGVIGYSVMSMVMTATPLAMAAHSLTLGDTAFVIQWHVLAMFAPAFFTGALIQRFGVLTIMLCGTGIFGLYGAAALSGIGINNFWLALTALGLGWNFTFIGASTLLIETNAPAEKAKVQGINDFLVFGSHATASLSAGALLHYLSWDAIHYVTMPLVLIAAVAIVWLMLLRRAQARPVAGT